MAETLRTIASSTAKLRELLKESKKDLHRIRLLLDALDEGLKGLWPFDAASLSGSAASLEAGASDSLLRNGDGAVTGAVAQLVADPGLWKETLAVVASGRIIGVAAEADEALVQASTANVAEKLWMGDGKVYARWLGRGAVWIVRDRGVAADSSKPGVRAGAQLLGKGIAVGYLDTIVEEVTRLMVLRRLTPFSQYYEMINCLTPLERRRFFSALLRYLAKLLSQDVPLSSPSERETTLSKKLHKEKVISATAALLQATIAAIPSLLPSLNDFLTSQPQSTSLARAAMAALPPSTQPEILQKTWAQFADKLHIQHTPILSQEANVCVLLLSAGYVHRVDPVKFQQLARSSMHNNAVSERLKSSSERVQWLGMCVGMAVSSLVDGEEKRIDFGVDQMQSEEAKMLRGLVDLKDEVGNVDDLAELFKEPEASSEKTTGKTKGNAAQKSAAIKGVSAKSKTSKPKLVEVVNDSGDEEDGEQEDDDLIPYAKPDADDPDSDEDATLVNRDKPKAPAYIRDLIANLVDTSNAPQHTLALQTATLLIRRKATFGSELHDRTQELAECLVSLQDQFETEDWHELRQSALVALVVAQPKIMGPWLARTLFEGDLSISQRIAVVTAIGLGGRELAGFKTEDDGTVAKVDAEAAAKALESDEAWPTQKLPGRLHEIYSSGDGSTAAAKRERQLKLESRKVETLTWKMEQAMLRPVSTKATSRPRPRTKILKNDLASLVADYFFFPLTRYWQVYSQASARSSNPLQDPLLTSLGVKTLSILLTAAGPAALSLPQLTKELFNLLLSVRSAAVRHPPVMEAVLFALLALLDIHAHETVSAATSGLRWLAEECGGPLVEFREWVGMVWEKLEGQGSGKMGLRLGGEGSGNGGAAVGDEETQRCKVLAASVLLKIREVVETYQRLLVGELSRV